MEIKSAVEIRNLSKKYDSFTAVANLSLSIMEGEIFGLLGPNGAGKTTTVKILCQLLRESSGEVIVHGIRIPDRRILSMIGYMPQDLALYPEITIEQTLEFFASLHLMEREDASRRIEELTKFVSLYERRKEMISRLSGGMKRRVSLIASMIHNPKILILDEPTVDVDPELRDSFWKHFFKLKENGHTIIITTHYMDEAMKCDRVAFMRDGDLLALGDPHEITRENGTESLEEAFLKLSREKKRVV